MSALLLLVPSQAQAQHLRADARTLTPSAATASIRLLAAQGLSPRAATAVPLTMARPTYETRLLHWINKARARHGLHLIRQRPCPDRFAEHWAHYLVSNNAFYHQKLGRIMSHCDLTRVGETLAAGSVSPWQMVRMWLHSHDHRLILLGRAYRIAGVAAYPATNGGWIGCIDFARR